MNYSEKELTQEELFFSNLPNPITRDYEVQIANFANHCSANKLERKLLDLIDNFSSYSFEAFFCLCTMYRRSKDYEKLFDLIQKHPEFKSNILYDHILVQFMVHSETFYDYDHLLGLAFSNTKKLSQNIGTLQAFSNAFATICEQCDKEERQIIIDKWYSHALDSINHAIATDPDYAKFYITKARLLALKGSFKEADNYVKIAIAKENSSRHDYALTILNYQSYRISFQFQQSEQELSNRIDKLEKLVESLQNSIPSDLNCEKATNSALPRLYTGDEPYAFISYAHKDQEDVYSILKKLNTHNVRFWYDKGIEPGTEWPEMIAERLINSDTIIAFISANSIASINVRKEVMLAADENKRVIIILMDDVDLTPGMRLQFGLFQMINKEKLAAEDLYSTLFSTLKKETETDESNI